MNNTDPMHNSVTGISEVGCVSYNIASPNNISFPFYNWSDYGVDRDEVTSADDNS